MSEILDAVVAGAPAEELARLEMPHQYRAALVKRSEVDMFEGLESSEKDPRRSLHVDEVALPELAPDEAFVAVMASSINFNTVWTSIFEPLPTFGFLDRLGKESKGGARHALDYHVVGSDASGVVLRVGSAVRNWAPGDKVTVHCNYVDDQDPSAHDDSMLAANQRVWGFESHFGGLGPRYRLRAPGSLDHGGVGVRRQTWRHRRDLRGDLGLHDRVRQPAPLDEAQDHQGLALRQLPGGVGRQSSGLRGPDPAAAVGRLPAGRRRAGGLPGPQEPPRGQDRRAVPGAVRGFGDRRPRAERTGGPGPFDTVPEVRRMSGAHEAVPGGLFTAVDHVAIAVYD